MAIGQSGGRSAGNRTARDASVRATPRERAAIDPPGHSEWEALEATRKEGWVLTHRGQKVAYLGSVLLTAFCVGLVAAFCALLLAEWFGVI